ncbi:MAG: hypothetical protein ACHQNA_08790, partial [Acidimicrobiales bacterium]
TAGPLSWPALGLTGMLSGAATTWTVAIVTAAFADPPPATPIAPKPLATIVSATTPATHHRRSLNPLPQPLSKRAP